jgi:hypothetical protein
MSQHWALIYGAIGGLAAVAVGFFVSLTKDQFPWEVSRRRTRVAVCMYLCKVVLYMAIGAFVAWTTVTFGGIYAAIVAGLAGPAALMKYVDEAGGNDGGGS